jgi:hypothetical protein
MDSTVSHLETLIAEYLDWQRYIVKTNTKVGPLKHGGWEMELDIVAYHPVSGVLLQYEPSIDALSWQKREARYKKKFEAGRRYIFSEVFTWLSPETPLQQIAVFVTHPSGRDHIAGGNIVSIDELVGEIKERVVAEGMMASGAIPEKYPLLRTIQLSHVGYYRLVQPKTRLSPAAQSRLHS